MQKSGRPWPVPEETNSGRINELGHRSKTSPLYRKHLIPRVIDPFRTGTDSVQGLLEYPDRETAFPTCICYSSAPGEYSHRLWRRIEALVEDGYAKITYHDETMGNKAPYHFIDSAELTIKGAILLDDLQAKSARGRVRSRMSDLIWVVVTTIVTTLATLKLTGG